MENQENKNEKLYPVLPNGESYRLQKIDNIQKDIEEEKIFRESLNKKYRKILTILNYTEGCSEAVGVVSGSIGIASLSGVVTAPLFIILEGIAIGCGVSVMFTKFFSRKLTKKARKHNEIRVLAASKLNTISSYISQSLQDGSISQEEFEMILKESEKFHTMKEEIRSKMFSVEQPKLPQSEKEKLIAETKKVLGRNSSKTFKIKFKFLIERKVNPVMCEYQRPPPYNANF